MEQYISLPNLKFILNEVLQVQNLTQTTHFAKSYPSEMGVQTTIQAIQILGGAGYCKDFPVEQYFRESHIHPIHEGTTGIQALDLLGRKVTIASGKAYQFFVKEVERTIENSLQFNILNKYALQLHQTLEKHQQITKHLLSWATKNEIEKYLADATLYLNASGLVAVAWQWLKQAETAIKNENQNDFYQSKIFAMRYYFDYELIKTESLFIALQKSEFITIEMQENFF
jgi:butyryl-CoA dehydrogenase